MTKIILIRHGESIANARRLYLGHTDWDLSELGKAQVGKTAEFLRDEPIDVIYSSDLLRAYNTALPNSEIHGLEIIRSKELREIYLGDWEGQSLEDIEKNWNDEFVHGWVENFGACTPPGGEPVPHLAQRIYNEVLRIARDNPNRTVLIACHAAAIRSFWGKICGIRAEDVAGRIAFPHNASFSTVFYDGESIVPGEYDVHFFLENGE